MKIQTNKHVLSNCGSLIVIEHYSHHHDDVLRILATWIIPTLWPEYTLHIDLLSDDYLPLSNIFVSKRPDTAIVGKSSFVTLELTVCHETNLIRSKQYKEAKYVALREDLVSGFRSHIVSRQSIEVTTLGFISNISGFTRKYLTNSLSQTVKNNITISAITNSLSIYMSGNIP